jgi:hypothetical protein
MEAHREDRDIAPRRRRVILPRRVRRFSGGSSISRKHALPMHFACYFLARAGKLRRGKPRNSSLSRRDVRLYLIPFLANANFRHGPLNR